MRITAKMLKEAGACQGQVDLFKRFLGKRKYVYLTKKNVRLARRKGLNIHWFLKTFGDQLQDYREYFMLTTGTGCAVASYIDKCPRDDTREAACRSSYWALRYAQDVDHGPRDSTREAASRRPRYAWSYALTVDKGPHKVTREGVHKDRNYGERYDRMWKQGET